MHGLPLEFEASAHGLAVGGQALGCRDFEQRLVHLGEGVAAGRWIRRRGLDFAEGGMLIDSFGSNIGKLTPLVSSDVYASTVQGFVLESLATRDPETLEWQPLLAESWKINDRTRERDAAIEKLRAEGKSDEEIQKDESVPPAIQVVFIMREGVSFSDGTPLTADDVVFTYQFTMNPQINAPRDRAYLSRISSVEKTGEREVTFTYAEPYFNAFELAASIGILPRHFYEPIKPETFNDSVGLLLGSGPYRLPNPENWRPGETVELLRNHRYWGVGGAIDRFIWRIFTS